MGKSNKGLVEYAIAQIGKPYWYGCFGQTSDESLLRSKRRQYPAYYKDSDFSSQLNKRVHDCVGLIKGYLWSASPDSPVKYNPNQDVSAKGMYAISKNKGGMNSFPRKPGTLVYKGGSPSSIHHVGVYIGDGYVVEAKGHKWGVVKSKLDSSWNFWSQCPFISVDTAKDTNTNSHSKVPSNSAETSKVSPIPSYKPILRLNSKGDEVTKLQRCLNKLGSKLSVDGIFGPNTKEALVKFQKANKLEPDGEYGPNTYKKLKDKIDNLK